MALTLERLLYQREYRARTGHASDKKYYYSEKGKTARAEYYYSEKGKTARAEYLSSPKGRLALKRSVKNQEIKRQTSLRAFASYEFSKIKNRAKNDNRGLNITATYLETLLENANGKCQLTGLPLSYKTGDLHKASFDRINNKKGYVYGNIQVVSQYVNTAKLDLTQDEYIAICKTVAANN